MLSLARLRTELNSGWLLLLFGVAYVVSQATLAIIVQPIGAGKFLWLQTAVFTAAEYRQVFGDWQQSGLLPFYRAHFLLDGAHWLWYSGLFTVALARLYEANRLSHRYDFVLALPLASGLCDWYENHLQQIFLSEPDFATIVDPLPLCSGLASWAKWLLVAVYLTVVVTLLVRYFVRSGTGSAED